MAIDYRIYLGQPVLSDTVQARLSTQGWGDGRFQAELRKELVYQLQRKDFPKVEDSAAAVAWLSVRRTPTAQARMGSDPLAPVACEKPVVSGISRLGKRKAKTRSARILPWTISVPSLNPS